MCPKETVTPSRGRSLRLLAATVLLLTVAGYLVTQYRAGDGGPPQCRVRTANGEAPYVIEPQQASNAATIEAVAAARRLPERAVIIALATAMQESTLRNIDHGDRDSLGLFQQRPSQGWGTTEEIMDPVYAAGEFYDHLIRVPGYTRLPLTEVAQRVQRSAYPHAYAKHEPNATLLAAALTGRHAAALTCAPAEDTGRSGDPAQVRRQLIREFGAGVLPDGPAAAGGGRRPAPGDLTIPVGRDRGAGQARRAGAPWVDPRRRGWELAHWAVAHAEELGIARIVYRDRVWTADNGWRANEGKFSFDVRVTTMS